MVTCLLLPVISAGDVLHALPPHPSPKKMPSELARERLRTRLSTYSSEYSMLRSETEEKLFARLRNKNLGWAERSVALGLLALAPAPPTMLHADLQTIVQDEKDSDYLRLHAALALALLGPREPAAIAVLRRVISPSSSFAISQSGQEQGLACLGLALFADTDSRPQILAVSRKTFNGIGHNADLALQLLGPKP